ncbi:MAG: TonB-dependent receptor [Bacteroidales bacterium]|nr:TonB-dependent receptor [Bacteroidales bacterium]MCB9012445.1 TonB-dependent receptor [Bacteroidales bacterium]
MKDQTTKTQFFRKLKWIFLFLIFSSPGLMAQLGVSGTVTDSNGEILIGVSITIQGTVKGTITGVDGSYSIQVPDNQSVLVFSYLGFKQVEEVVGNRTNINVTLEEDLQKLDELVVVAYGTQKQSRLTSAVSSIKNVRLDEIPVSGVDKALMGKLAGVQILNYNPEAGAAPNIRVRGMGSISANNEPLVVVDGYPISGGLSMVSMGDVESIEVLKDAASASLYGSRAAAGVILVTTKSGSSKKTKYNFKMYTGISNPLKLPQMMSTEEYVTLLNNEANLRMLDPSVDGTSATMPFNLTTNPERTAYLISKYVVDQPTDWLDEALRNHGSMKSYQLSASGGDLKKQYYISGNYNSEDGIMKNSTYDKFSLRTKVDIKLTDKVKAGINFNPTFSRRERPAVNLTDYMRFPSWMPVRHNLGTAAMTGKVAGEYAQVPDFTASTISGIGVNGEMWNMVGENPWTSGNQTPVSIRERTSRFDDSYRAQTNTYLSVDILPGLTFKTSNGVYFSYTEYNMKEQSEANKAGLPNTLTRQMTLYTDLLSENILTYDKSLGDHEINVLGGYTLQKSSNNYNQMVATGFPDEERLSFNMASELLKNTGSVDGVTSFYTTEALMSVLGRINYAYKGRYLLTASFRADGSSKFAAGHKWGTFPSVSAGWRISEEEFLKNSALISNLKVRASYGVTGNNEIPTYSYMNQVSTIDYVTGSGNGNLVTGMSSTDVSLGNPDITWEQTGETNLGFELGMWKNRFNLSMELYNANTIQMLLRQPSMYITGHQSFWNNIGEVNNKGIELELKTTNIDRSNFNWTTTANFSANKNTLLNYGNKLKEDNFGERAEVYRANVGEQAIQFYGYKSDGVYTSFEEVAAALALTDENGVPFDYKVFKPIIGGLKVVNTDGNNSLDADDRVILGSPFPHFTWGITNTISYKDFDLSFMFQGVQGGQLVNGNIYYNEQLRMNKAYTANRFVSPAYPGDGKTVYSTTTPGNQIMLTDYTIEDASYASLRDFSVGYTLPNKISKSLKISNFRAYFSAANLIYIMAKGYRGVNPEARNTSGTYNNPLIDGYQRGVFPLNRTYTVGVDITF